MIRGIASVSVLIIVSMCPTQCVQAAAKLENFDSPERIFNDHYSVCLKDGSEWKNHITTVYNFRSGDAVTDQASRAAYKTALAADKALLESIAADLATKHHAVVQTVLVVDDNYLDRSCCLTKNSYRPASSQMLPSCRWSEHSSFTSSSAVCRACGRLYGTKSNLPRHPG